MGYDNDTLSGCLVAIVGILFSLAIVVGWAFLISLPVMWLWNWLMPMLFGLPTLTWVQALGLNLLCGFLFRTSVNVNNGKK